MPAQNPVYRNNRKSFYSEKGPDSVSVGTIVNVFKTKPNDNSYDSQYLPATTPVNGTTAYVDITGNPQPENNPDYQYYGYLYCDGSEYNISDYPLLYSIIGNEYGGTANQIGGVQINPENVFSYWPDPSMGTFKVPDFKAKKLVGYGPVYGPGTPTIGNVEMEVGATGGFWYLSKEAQKGYFNFGNIKTTGYTDVQADVPGTLVGYQTVTVTLDDNDLNGVPQHEHYLLHSEAPNIQGFNSGNTADPYLSSYKNRTARTIGFSPSGGIKLTHSHALSKQRITGTNVATYDLFNWSGGDQGPGSINQNGNYWASGPSGQFEDITYTPPSLFRIFDEGSQIGGVSIITDGQPFYNETTEEYPNPGPNQTFGLPVGTDILELEIYGAGGSGGVWTTAGNNGGDTVVQIGDGTGVTITCGGGKGGGAAVENTTTIPYTEVRGSGGPAGTNTITGTYAADVVIENSTQENEGTQGIPGNSDGKFWNAAYSATDPLWLGYGGGGTYGVGSTGLLLSVAASAKGNVTDVTYPNTAPFAAQSSDSGKYTVSSAYIYCYGSKGRDCQNLGGAYTTGVGQYSTNSGGCSTGAGGSGKYAKLSILAEEDGKINSSYYLYPGQQGQVYSSTSTATFAGDGGRGGNGYLQDGGGGGAATVITTENQTTVVAGVGGGGGGGGAGEGQCGDSGTNSPFTDSVQKVSVNLFTGGGGNGGNYGCTGGGGGGGGGGVGTAGQAGGSQGGGDSGGATAGGDGGGGGGFGGHGGGYGGARGLSSYNENYFSLTASGNVLHGGTGYPSSSTESRSGTNEGRLRGEVNENRSYWTSAAGGGGAGGYMKVTIPESVMENINASSVTMNIGTGADGVSNSISRTIDNSINWTESASTTTSTKAGDGYVKVTAKVYAGSFGGTEVVTSGDIVVKASSGIELYTSGTGVGTAGGFKLPTTQLPVVQILAQGDQPGSGATASATVVNGVVTGVTLGNGGSGYTSAPVVRFLNGAGGGTKALTTITGSGIVASIDLVVNSSENYTRYVKFGGPETERYVVLGGQDCTNVESFAVKCARGNDINGGERPDDSGDQLLLYYNTDSSLNFPETNFIGVLVPRPSDTDISTNYDGNGLGGDSSTLWYTYTLDIPAGAQTTGVRFKIVQKRVTPSGANDNGGNNDHFGICEFVYNYKFISESQFVSTPGEIPVDSKILTYNIEGSANSAYSAGIDVNDMRFTLSSGVALNPVPALDPVRPIPLLEPYALSKYLIKAF